MILYYENALGQKIDFMKRPYRAVEADIFEADWEAHSDGYEKRIEIDVMDKKGNFFDNMNALYDIIAVDADNNTYGKLCCNGSYIRCYVKKKEATGWKGNVYAYVTLTFVAPELAWITEEKKTFLPGSGRGQEGGFDYPHNFPYNYSAIDADIEWNIKNTAPCDFAMIIYGTCVDPEIIINDHSYQVFTTLEANEYMIIDSRTQTITKHLESGSDINVYNDRSTMQSVFHKINPGRNIISWTHAFGFDIILYKSRKEPVWK